MSIVRRSKPAAAVALVAAFLCPAVLAQKVPSYTGQVGVYVPERTEAGSWDGTWYYQSALVKMVLWMRTRRGKVEAKLRYEGVRGPLTFETDWTGASSYYTDASPSSFAMKFGKTAPADIEGSWDWTTRYRSTSRSETGKFDLYRARDGRTLVVKFGEYELVTIREGKTARVTTPPVWTFLKASKREVLWDEIPF
jgi:hypothetical protein